MSGFRIIAEWCLFFYPAILYSMPELPTCDPPIGGYRFGPNIAESSCSEKEWRELRNTVVEYEKTDSLYVLIFCPHCGSRNITNIIGLKYRECDLLADEESGSETMYKCPGYILKRKRAVDEADATRCAELVVKK